MKNNFSEFTGLYEISKTLRFELKPQLETLDNLQRDNVIVKDREVQENYNEIKKYLDELHMLFVEKSLENIDLSLLEDFNKIYLELKKDSKNKKNKTNFEKISKDLRKELVSFFDAQ
jgi:CRISPR-associated protein Cpf1